MVNLREHNSDAWDREAIDGSPCSKPVGAADIAAARAGNWGLRVTGSEPVPSVWLPDVRGLRVLCLGGGGGQQAPILAAAGGKVTVVDLSPAQLALDRFLAERHALSINTIQTDMSDLNVLTDRSFDVVVHPVSNQYVPDCAVVWREASRVLEPQGILIAGFINPVDFALDRRLYSRGILQIRHALPYSDFEILTEHEQSEMISAKIPFEFGHTFQAQIGGQTDAGFAITGFFEDRRTGDILSKYMPSYFATRAIKMR
jgi:2-polyprenyl-3-methyl-5-hydroxy-6-metoxy-1,4-benzoquinol methylase